MKKEPEAPVIRAIANTLCDHNIDVINERDGIKILTVLINAGWSAADLHANVEAAIMMASIRQRNDMQRSVWLKRVKSELL
jgi:hypothetical protein